MTSSGKASSRLPPLVLPREAGFTLLEILIATTVLLVALLLASGLLIRSQLVASRSVDELRDPQSRHAELRLRRDLEAAHSVSALIPGWDSGQLAISLAGGRVVAWERDGTTLLRIEGGGTEEASPPQVLLNDVTRWRWRLVSPKLVDVEIRYSVADASRPVLEGVPSSWRTTEKDRSRVLRVALRRGFP